MELKAALGISRFCLYNCKYILAMSHSRGVSHDVDEGAVAAVARFLVGACAFRFNELAASAGEVEKCWVVEFEFCFRARRAPLADFDRSMVAGGVEMN